MPCPLCACPTSECCDGAQGGRARPPPRGQPRPDQRPVERTAQRAVLTKPCSGPEPNLDLCRPTVRTNRHYPLIVHRHKGKPHNGRAVKKLLVPQGRCAEDEHETWNYCSRFAFRAGDGRVFHHEQMGDPPRDPDIHRDRTIVRCGSKLRRIQCEQMSSGLPQKAEHGSRQSALRICANPDIPVATLSNRPEPIQKQSAATIAQAVGAIRATLMSLAK
jgi:hypothetical protein